jgi:hypothetical protein
MLPPGTVETGQMRTIGAAHACRRVTLLVRLTRFARLGPTRMSTLEVFNEVKLELGL